MKAIQLTKGFVAYVDDEDFERINAFKWCASIESRGTKVYAIRRERDHSKPPERRLVTIKKNGKRVRVRKLYYPTVKIRMHRQVMNLPIYQKYQFVVDHLNGDSLDNTKKNLEVITQEENMKRVDNWKRKSEEVSL